jgi:predicted nucleic-acid-binding protein
MEALIDTNIFVQYIAKTDELSLKKISDLVKIYDKFIINDNVFFESVFILENKLGLTRYQIDEEIFCLIENPLFELNLSFDIYLFLSLYTQYTSLDIIDIYLLIQSRDTEVLTLDADLSKKIKTVKF